MSERHCFYPGFLSNPFLNDYKGVDNKDALGQCAQVLGQLTEMSLPYLSPLLYYVHMSLYLANVFLFLASVFMNVRRWNQSIKPLCSVHFIYHISVFFLLIFYFFLYILFYLIFSELILKFVAKDKHLFGAFPLPPLLFRISMPQRPACLLRAIRARYFNLGYL